jgi:23S rRNA (cytosine1962-C5)-methyltransferase
MPSVILKPRRERSLLRRHPWVFSGAIARIEGQPESGETLEVLSADGTWLARGAYSPQSQIPIRVWSFDAEEAPSAEFFRRRLERAVDARPAKLTREGQAACRVVHAESDALPGVVVDRYADFLVCQFLTAGAERWKSELTSQLIELLPSRGIYERSDVPVRVKEGLPPSVGVLWGVPPPERVEIREGPCRFLVDIRAGHKTGFYLDQRENRAWMREYAAGAEVLDGFAYSGAFGIWALLAGAARVTDIESSPRALELGKRQVVHNRIDPARTEQIHGDVSQVLRGFRDAGRQFDLIVLDPPKFAESRAQLERASRGYKDVNLLAFKLLRPGGTLLSFSCSGLLAPELFQKIVADAALDACRDAQIGRWLSQAPDHPTALSFPEGRYLKGLLCRVV